MIAWLQQQLFEAVVQPLLFRLGWMSLAEDLYDWCEWLVLGAVEITVVAIVFGVLERWRPIEAVTDRRAVLTDVVYTLVHRLGLFSLALFLFVLPWFDALEAQLRLAGIGRPNVDQLWPGVTDRPLVSFAIYVVLLDLADYWIHRGQHRLGWWWQLHAVHHSQRQMTFWSDSRNHLLDSLLHDTLFALVSVFIGVAPDQFIVLTLVIRVLQSVQHANFRLVPPVWMQRLVVAPGFHRLHHAIEPALHRNAARGINFAVLLPVWDHLFGTADWSAGFVPTGVSDQLQGRDYGRGFWAQQWLALRRLARRAS